VGNPGLTGPPAAPLAVKVRRSAGDFVARMVVAMDTTKSEGAAICFPVKVLSTLWISKTASIITLLLGHSGNVSREDQLLGGFTRTLTCGYRHQSCSPLWGTAIPAVFRESSPYWLPSEFIHRSFGNEDSVCQSLTAVGWHAPIFRAPNFAITDPVLLIPARCLHRTDPPVFTSASI
ncbi:hypothetical protein Cfor_09702, partial [Coptotermes formosanus]